MGSLDVISVNIWQILISLCNLLLIFLMFKKFLYKPVRKFTEKRKAMVDKQFADAQEVMAKAEADKELYENKLKSAQIEADEKIKDATIAADRRREKIIADAKEKADAMVRQAQSEIEIEKKKASDEIKHEIADVSTILTEKMLEREINTDDHRDFIDSFIQGIGEDDGTDN